MKPTEIAQDTLSDAILSEMSGEGNIGFCLECGAEYRGTERMHYLVRYWCWVCGNKEVRPVGWIYINRKRG